MFLYYDVVIGVVKNEQRMTKNVTIIHLKNLIFYCIGKNQLNTYFIIQTSVIILSKKLEMVHRQWLLLRNNIISIYGGV